MKREEAIREIQWLHQVAIEAGRDHDESDDAVGAAIDAIRGPVPDPVTGLVPCKDCGAAAKIDMKEYDGENWMIYCPQCCVGITFSVAYGDGDIAKAKLIGLWNRAMGMKEADE